MATYEKQKSSKSDDFEDFCLVLIKKMQIQKPCSATVCWIVTFLFRPFCEKYTKQSEPPHYQRLVLS